MYKLKALFCVVVLLMDLTNIVWDTHTADGYLVHLSMVLHCLSITIHIQKHCTTLPTISGCDDGTVVLIAAVALTGYIDDEEVCVVGVYVDGVKVEDVVEDEVEVELVENVDVLVIVVDDDDDDVDIVEEDIPLDVADVETVDEVVVGGTASICN